MPLVDREIDLGLNFKYWFPFGDFGGWDSSGVRRYYIQQGGKHFLLKLNNVSVREFVQIA